MSVWIDDRLVRADDLVGAALDRAALLGDGLFETILVRGERVIDLEAHLDRLERSARTLALPDFAPRRESVHRAVEALLEDDGSVPRRALRVTYSAGCGRGLTRSSDAVGRLAVALSPIGPPPESLRAVLLDTPRIDPLGPTSGHKTTSALHWVLARAEATRRAADVALVRTIDGDVAEADAANLFLVVDDTLVTPPLDRGVLPGMQRARLLDAAAREHVRVRERRVDAVELNSVRALLVTSSLIGVVPIVHLDGRPLRLEREAIEMVQELLPDGCE